MRSPRTAPFIAAAAALCAAAGSALAGSPIQYEITVLPQIDDTSSPDLLTYTTPRALNDAVVVVGELGNELGFVWSAAEGADELQPMFAAQADKANGAAIDNAGNIAGTYHPVGGSFFATRAYHLSAAGVFSPLPGLTANQNTGVSAMNENGIIVGTSGNRSVYWHNVGGTFEVFDIGGLGGFVSGAAGINNSNVVVGSANTAQAQAIKPYRWTQEGGFEVLPQFVPGVPASTADINDSNIVVGRGGISLAQNAAVYWDAAGEIHQLPSASANPVDIGALAINNDGVIVGFELGDDDFVALVWIDGQVHELRDITADVPEGYELARATDINEHGDIAVETRIMVDGQYQFLTLVLSPIGTPGNPADLDGDGDVDSTDLNTLLADFGCTGGGCAGDTNGDGGTDSQDLNALLAAFGTTGG